MHHEQPSGEAAVQEAHDGRTPHHDAQPYSTFVGIWILLMILTCVTVGGSLLYPGAIGTGIAMAVTPIKAALVLLFFMHLKWEPPVFKIMFLATVAILASFMSLSFFDYLYR